MKSKKLNRLVRIHALRGFVFGLVVSLITILIAADSDVYHETERTWAEFVRVFPAIWVVMFFPLLCAVAGYFMSVSMSKIIKRQR